MTIKLPQQDRKETAEQFKRETVSRWEEYCHTGKSVPHEVVMKWLESWGTENDLEAPNCSPVRKDSRFDS